MTVAILDSYAIAFLDGAFVPEHRVQGFNELSAQVSAGALTFPDEVAKECRTLIAETSSAVWAGACAGQRTIKTSPGGLPQVVLHGCPELLDENDPGEQSQIHVACLAFHLKSEGTTVTVVTEDVGSGGSRISLAEACEVLSIPAMSLHEYLKSIGISDDWIDNV